MNKNFKVIQIHGLSGLLLLGFIVVGLFCGFILFPIWIIMIGWNEVSVSMFSGPVINYYQASLLWLFLALSSYLILRNSISVKIQKPDDSEQEELDKIIEEGITEQNLKNEEVSETNESEKID